MTTQQFPARLHLLIPKNHHQGIVIRRGPSKHVCILGWDRSNDTFTVSQWLKGRIYERRSDISPDGKYWIYFAMNGKWDREAKGSWTAVAFVPWLKAIELYPKGDCWHGGGLFLDNKTYWLNGDHHEPIITSKQVTQSKSYQPQHQYGGECLNVYYNRLQRDGWKLKSRTRESWYGQAILEKQLLHGWKIRKICHEQVDSPPGKGCYWDEHELHNENGSVIAKSGWEWAEWLDKALFFAQNGCLYKITIPSSSNLNEEQLIHDFNPYKFEPKQAPY